MKISYTPQMLINIPSKKYVVRLRDNTAWKGFLSTELLSEKSLSVYIDAGEDGATLYLDQIVSITPIE